jgi:hypothetical protein
MTGKVVGILVRYTEKDPVNLLLEDQMVGLGCFDEAPQCGGGYRLMGAKSSSIFCRAP